MFPYRFAFPPAVYGRVFVCSTFLSAFGIVSFLWFFFFFSILLRIQWYLRVFICDTFLTNDDHLYMCFIYLLQYLYIFFVGLSVHVCCLFSYLVYLIIKLFLIILCLFLDISYLIDVCILRVFSFCGLSFDFLMVVFKELFLILIKSNILTIIWFRLFVYYLRNLCLLPKVMKTLSYVFCRSFICIAFTLGL